MKKRFWLFGLIICFLMLAGCGASDTGETDTMPIYYISNSETKIETHEYALQSQTETEQIEELLAALAQAPLKKEYKAPLAMGFEVLGYTLEDGKLLLNMGQEYKELSVVQELLVRAAIVRTMVQLPGINFVAIRVNDEHLFDSLGQLVGWMNADTFVENEGNEINAYAEVRLKLYFANETGDGLMAIYRTREYNTNISIEKIIVEELIKGPNAEGVVYPTINPDTKVANVAVKDGICYVNLDETFLTQIYNVTPEVTIYSIVNSLVEQTGVNKVQISINGDSSGVYREKYSFTTYFERNLDIVTTIE